MNGTNKKTLFISMTRASAARSYLRSLFLQTICRHKEVRVVIIVPYKVHDYFRKEFESEHVIVEEVPLRIPNKVSRIFAELFNSLVYSKAEFRHLKYGSSSGSRKKNSLPVFWTKHIFFTIISKIVFLRYIARWIERHILIDHSYKDLFDKYNPDLLFCTTIYATLDTALIKEATYRSVPTISTPKSWDTVGRMFFRFPSEKLIVTNQWMKDWIAKEQLIDPKNIEVAGLIQFDVYGQKKDYLSKEAFCNRTGLDPRKPIILYAPQGIMTGDDELYVREFLEEETFLQKYNLIIRPHFTDIVQKRYDIFKKTEGVFVDDANLRITMMFPDMVDPTWENVEWQAEVVHAADVVLCFMSTMVIDAHILNKPVITIKYEPKGTTRKIPIDLLYAFTHFEAISTEKSFYEADSKESVLKFIIEYVNNPHIHELERKHVVEKFAGRVDGKVGEVTAEIILNNLIV